jgi:hypothetical protein
MNSYFNDYSIIAIRVLEFFMSNAYVEDGDAMSMFLLHGSTI